MLKRGNMSDFRPELTGDVITGNFEIISTGLILIRIFYQVSKEIRAVKKGVG